MKLIELIDKLNTVLLDHGNEAENWTVEISSNAEGDSFHNIDTVEMDESSKDVVTLWAGELRDQL